MPTAATHPPRIVILGGGYGGVYCAQALERRLRRPVQAQITLVDRHNYFVCYPLLVEAGTGSLEPRHAVVSIRAFLKRSRFMMAEVTAVDTARRIVTVRLAETGQTHELPYDHLVIALGSITRLPNVPGLRQFAGELKSLSDAVAMRDRAIALLETADATSDPNQRRELLHFVVVGGNFTGVEVAGELDAFLNAASRNYRRVHIDEIKVTLVERGPKILGVLGDDLADYAMQNLRRRGVDVRVNDSVTEVGKDFAVLQSGERLRTHMVMWCAGIAPTPVTLGMPVPRDEHGYILCDPDCRVKGLPDVWAIGDCAVLHSSSGAKYPATAQHAIREGKHLAANLARVIRGESPTESDIESQGSLAALGCRTGVAKIFGVKLSGFWAWWMWRTVYLLKTPGWGRRVRVAVDWTLDLFFRRDYVQLGVHKRNSA
ncbi:MAG: NAD(P)/FAD-dependent oxidoreductase [Phycisphaerales bacterium]